MNALRFVAVMLTAIAMAGGLAHLFALPNKMPLSRDEDLIAQQVYRGWAFLGVAVIGALLATILLAMQVRGRPREFPLTVTAAVCIALSLVVFFAFTFPANQVTLNWTVLPEQWEGLRRQWEYSHAVGAVLYVVALGALTLSLLPLRE